MIRPTAEVQSSLWNDILRFIEVKRAKGCRYDTEYREVRLFYRFAINLGVKSSRAVTRRHVNAFLATCTHRKPKSYNHMLQVLQQLFRWLCLQDVIKDSPVKAKPRKGGQRRVPYIFEDAVSRALIREAGRLPCTKRYPLRGPVYETVYSVLRGLGLRETEAGRARICDVDLERSLLVVRFGKFGKTRLAPFGPRMRRRLKAFLAQRCTPTTSPNGPLFTLNGRTPISATSIQRTLTDVLLPRLRLPPSISKPRVHDLRHSFAVATMVHWYRTGADPRALMDHLSTYLGHVDVNATQVYLSVTADIMRLSRRRFERYATAVFEGGRGGGH